MTLARRARLAAGLPADDFAKLIGADVSTYLTWENGSKKPSPTAMALLRLIEADPDFCFETLRRTRSGKLRGHVLIVVAEEDSRAALWDICEEEGFETSAVETGREAIEFLKRGVVPCAIVLDVTVPVINGFQLMSWLRQQGEPLTSCPVISVSGDPAHAEAAARDGVVRHFSRPLEVSQVLEEIKQHCKAA